MATQDHYKTLGVSQKAPADEIKKAYRKLAKKFHPDVTGGDKTKEARFKDISQAYEVLGDAKKRAEYDERGANPFGGGAGFPGARPGGHPGGIPIDLEELLRNRGGGGFDVFGDLFGGGARGGGAAQRTPRRGEDVAATLEIELPEAALGAEKPIVVDGKRLTVKIPPGVTSGKTIRLQGQGAPGMRGAPAGDLLIEVHERPNLHFRRRAPGSPDIEADVEVPVDVAILGGKADMRTLEGGAITLTVPPGTSSGQKLRMKGKGAYSSSGTRGDLFANVLVQIPRDLPDSAREHLHEFARLTRK